MIDPLMYWVLRLLFGVVITLLILLCREYEKQKASATIKQRKSSTYAPVTPNSQQYQKRASQRSKRVPTNTNTNKPSSIPTAQKRSAQTPVNPLYAGLNSSTQSHLLRLVGHDRALAERLVDQIQSNTGQCAQWCWEKAILDLERDRH